MRLILCGRRHEDKARLLKAVAAEKVLRTWRGRLLKGSRMIVWPALSVSASASASVNVLAEIRRLEAKATRDGGGGGDGGGGRGGAGGDGGSGDGGSGGGGGVGDFATVISALDLLCLCQPVQERQRLLLRLTAADGGNHDDEAASRKLAESVELYRRSLVVLIRRPANDAEAEADDRYRGEFGDLCRRLTVPHICLTVASAGGDGGMAAAIA